MLAERRTPSRMGIARTCKHACDGRLLRRGRTRRAAAAIRHSTRTTIPNTASRLAPPDGVPECARLPAGRWRAPPQPSMLAERCAAARTPAPPTPARSARRRLREIARTRGESVTSTGLPRPISRMAMPEVSPAAGSRRLMQASTARGRQPEFALRRKRPPDHARRRKQRRGGALQIRGNEIARHQQRHARILAAHLARTLRARRSAASIPADSRTRRTGTRPAPRPGAGGSAPLATRAGGAGAWKQMRDLHNARPARAALHRHARRLRDCAPPPPAPAPPPGAAWETRSSGYRRRTPPAPRHSSRASGRFHSP